MQDDKKIKQIQKLLDVAEGNLQSARNLLLDILGEKKTGKVDHSESAKDLSILDEGKVIEGVFDGEQMVAPDSKKYPVPANYASKSKLVEGDTLKLTIADDGSLIYKQIKPVERKNLIGTLAYDNGNYTFLADGKTYKVLFASVTYYKGEPGSKASIVVPAAAESQWAALESVIHDHDGTEEKTEGKKTETAKKKIDLPEENKEILEEVKESFGKEKKKEAGSEKEKPEVEIKKTEPEITEDMTVQEASKASTTEEAPKEEPTESVEDHPDIKKQGAYMTEEETKIGKEEKEENALGETPPPVSDNKAQGIEELEI